MDKTKALTWTELRVGVVAIVSLAVLAFTILYIGSGGGSPLARKYVLKALMSDVNGLKPGAPVRVGGVEVGSVTRVDFAEHGGKGLVEVTMRLDARVKERVTTKSQAALGALGLLGEKAVDISASSEGIPVGDGELVPAMSEDPFKGLLTDASDSTAHLRRILARMDAGEGLVGKALRDDELYNRMSDVSLRLQGLMTKLESDKGPLGRMMNDEDMSRRLASSVKGFDTVVARLESGEGTLGSLSRDQELAKDLKGLTSRLSAVAERLDKGQGTAGKLLQDDVLFKRLDDVSLRLDSVLQRLEKSEGTAGRLLSDPALYNNLNAALTEARGLVSDVRKDPRKYLRLKLSLF
jgi:phospholipid/cholesterol/gamma-HCH transport system substrate-binding protein